MSNKKNILICPLEWGLGHAARMIPVAAELINRGNRVVFASGKEHLNLIRNELPKCELISFAGFNPRYSRFLPQYIWMLFKIPSLIYHIVSEHFKLKKIIKEYSVDLVISDNRFGLWNSKTTSVYVTHMPRIPFPKMFRFFEPVGVFIHRMIIKRYDWLLVPDLPEELNLSGRLSHGLKLPSNARYVGVLSRFAINRDEYDDFEKTHNLVILSGPEPQREMLKQKLTAIFKNKRQTTIILGGKPNANVKEETQGNIILYNHLSVEKMRSAVAKSKCIITRSGYSTIMDLVTIGCSALLIPTPGQTEQEYLAERLTKQGLFASIKQNQITDLTITPESNIIRDSKLIAEQSSVLLKKTLDEILNQSVKNSQFKKTK